MTGAYATDLDRHHEAGRIYAGLGHNWHNAARDDRASARRPNDP
jgi:hypothetical protein